MKEHHNDLCIGIDLGTTNSVLAIVNTKANGDLISKVVEIPRAVDMYNTVSSEVKLSTQKKATLSSCVYYREENGYEPLVGDFARMQYPLRPHLVSKSIKSQMGKSIVEGLSNDIPDKTPAEVSAKILKHMIVQAGKIFRCNISNAVITVPASFDSAMCKATRDAAELAGIKVKNGDGSEIPILLPEPNAVMYDLINQIQNGEIPSQIVDLSTEKNILVFDIGGGTLDITIHEISRSENHPEVLKVSEIATNRYTRLGGDDFDYELAKTMFERYLLKYEKHLDVTKMLQKEKLAIMPQMINYAEQLKIDLNERCNSQFETDWYDSGWDDDDDEGFDVGGNMGGIGYSYDDVFTQKEVEDILDPFMGRDLLFEDYKRIDIFEKKGDTKNIIYPILDVLKKASDKMEDVVVDAVLVNGGMSKFYMITDRLKEFFGFEPIVALDPDQAVARGAAVYHHYLNKYEEIKQDMRTFESEVSNANNHDFTQKQDCDESSNQIERAEPIYKSSIEWQNSILNDSLYLGIKNGGIHKIIPTGSELPYNSDFQKGFKLIPGQNMISIPIKSQNLDGSYRTIAQGKMEFCKNYPNGAYVSFKINMSKSKVITMETWTSSDESGKEIIELGSTEIEIDNSEYKKLKFKVAPPKGSILQPQEELNNLLQLCRNLERNSKNKKNSGDINLISRKISSKVSDICSAGNPQDFGKYILTELQSGGSNYIRMRLFTIARNLGLHWNEDERAKLATISMDQLTSELNGLSRGGEKTAVDIQAIFTLSICSEESQLKRLKPLHSKSKFLQACLYTHAKTKTEVAWIYRNFSSDKKKLFKNDISNIQFSAHSIGVAFTKNLSFESSVKKEEVIEDLYEIVCSGLPKEEALVSCLLALAGICDQRSDSRYRLKRDLVSRVYNLLENIDGLYPKIPKIRYEKARLVATKMIEGIPLNDDEERFLLLKLEK